MVRTLWGHYYWPAFLTVVSLFFLVPEFIALITNSANTLSDYAWSEMNVSMSYSGGVHTAGWWLSLVVFIVAAVLLVIHIWWRGV
jgi:hypothetical protein